MLMLLNLKHKLTTYYSIAGAALVSANQASAQVIKTSVNYSGGLESYNIDLDNDGNDDFAVRCFAWGSGYEANSFNLQAFGNNELIKDPDISGSFKYVDLFAQGDLISSGKDFDFQSNVWAGGSSYVRGMFGGGYKKNPGGQVYDWGNVGGKNGFFVGVKFSIGSDTHYGWLRFNVATKCNSWRLVDMAYESTPNTSVYTDNPLFVSEKSNDLNIEINDNSVLIYSDASNFSKAEVLSVTGALVRTITCADGKAAFSKESLSGMYIITLYDARGVVTRKKIVL
jgi:hypothetical protein